MGESTKRMLAAFAAGVVFALGLGVSGMTLPEKVIGFLDVTGGAWDPALAFVMGGAVLVYAVGFRLITRREAPRFGGEFSVPKRRDINTRLLVGAVIFGVGWGLAGYCPGPAITSVVTLEPEVIVFVAAMFGGMRLFAWAHGMSERATREAQPRRSE